MIALFVVAAMIAQFFLIGSMLALRDFEKGSLNSRIAGWSGFFFGALVMVFSFGAGYVAGYVQ